MTQKRNRRSARQVSRARTRHDGSNGTRDRVFALLVRDHRNVTAMIDRLLQDDPASLPRRSELFARMRDELDAHSRAEETVLYSQLERQPATHDLIARSIEQHHVVTVLLGELDAMPKDHARWTAKLAVLRDALHSHIALEEREVFPRAHAVLDAESRRMLGGVLARQRSQWLDLERNAPGPALRGLTQMSERSPSGSGMIATAVHAPRAVAAVVAAGYHLLPRRGIAGMLFRTAAAPLLIPLAIAARSPLLSWVGR